jgi:vacuolar-type H+-ATPase subunit E/Vma4
MEDKKIISIEDDVNDKANLLIDRINQEIEYLRNKSLKKYKAKLEQEIDAYRENELDELKLATASEISVSKLENKKNLLKLREKYVVDIFDLLDKKVIEFKKSEKYYKCMLKCLENYNLDYTKGFFLVKEEDKDFFENLLKEKNINSAVKADYIRLGGFKFESTELSILIDETLDSRVENQREWFQENSGFII